MVDKPEVKLRFSRFKQSFDQHHPGDSRHPSSAEEGTFFVLLNFCRTAALTLAVMPDSNPNEFRNFEHQGWQSVAEQYDSGFGDVTAQSVGPILDAVHASKGVQLLDIACGPGYVASAAARRG